MSVIAPPHIIEMLRSKGILVSAPESTGMCWVSDGIIDDNPFSLYFYSGRMTDYLIVKIMYDKVDCFEALYSPKGLFAFIREENDINKLIQKINNIIKINKEE